MLRLVSSPGAGAVAAGRRAQTRRRPVAGERGWSQIPARSRGEERRWHEGRGSADCLIGAPMMRRRDRPGRVVISEGGRRQRAAGLARPAIEVRGGEVRATKDRETAARVEAETLRKSGSSRSSMRWSRLSIEGSRTSPTNRMKAPRAGSTGQSSNGPWLTKKAANQCRQFMFSNAKASSPSSPISGLRASR
jgi:hypothetical protein